MDLGWQLRLDLHWEWPFTSLPYPSISITLSCDARKNSARILPETNKIYILTAGVCIHSCTFLWGLHGYYYSRLILGDKTQTRIFSVSIGITHWTRRKTPLLLYILLHPYPEFPVSFCISHSSFCTSHTLISRMQNLGTSTAGHEQNRR